MKRRDLDTQGIGKRALTVVQTIIEDAGHFLQSIDGGIDKGIDGYIRLRKRTKGFRVINKKKVPIEDYEETGNLIGVQVKGVSAIPKVGSRSYYISLKEKEAFAVNFGKAEALDKLKFIWSNFIGPMILIFVDLKNKKCWWVDLKDEKSFSKNGYSIIIQKRDEFTIESFRSINKLGKELFSKKKIPNLKAKNHNFHSLSLSNFKESAKDAYANLSGSGEFFTPTQNPILGTIRYTRSGWKHITRLNRRKMRIFNSILLLGVSKLVCENVTKFTSVKKGLIRESGRYIKRVEFITLRANVYFNFRQSSIVQVVLRRVKTFDKIHFDKKVEDQIFFHSVYEPYRKE
jgi:hypothetical protein